MAWKYFGVVADHMACPCGCGFGANPAEFNHYLMEQLDLLRELWGAPLALTSGARCLAHNAAVGGEKHSAHTPDDDRQCRAVDLALPGHAFWPTSRIRKELIQKATRCGFQRIGIGRNFLHVDVASEHGGPGLPEGYWVYGDIRG